MPCSEQEDDQCDSKVQSNDAKESGDQPMEDEEAVELELPPRLKNKAGKFDHSQHFT